MRYVLIICGLVLPGCSNAAPETPLMDAATAGAAAIRAGVDAQRATTLRTNVVSAGQDCPAVTETFFQGTHPNDGTEYWNVACGTSGDYAIMTRAGEDARAMSCAAARNVTGVDCFIAFEPQQEPGQR